MTFLLPVAFDSRGANKKVSFFFTIPCFLFVFMWTISKRWSERRSAYKIRSPIFSAHFNHEDGDIILLRKIDKVVRFHTLLPPRNMINIAVEFLFFLVDVSRIHKFINFFQAVDIACIVAASVLNYFISQRKMFVVIFSSLFFVPKTKDVTKF